MGKPTQREDTRTHANGTAISQSSRDILCCWRLLLDPVATVRPVITRPKMETRAWTSYDANERAGQLGQGAALVVIFTWPPVDLLGGAAPAG